MYGPETVLRYGHVIKLKTSPINFTGHECSASYNLYHVVKLNKRKGPIFSIWNLVSKVWVVWRNWNFSCKDTSYFRFWAKKMFSTKILWILPKFHEKTLSHSGDIKIFRPGRRMYIYQGILYILLLLVL